MKKAALFTTLIVPTGYFSADLILAIATVKMAGFKGKVSRKDKDELTEADRAGLKTLLFNIGGEIDAPRGNYDFSRSRKTGLALAILSEFNFTINRPVIEELTRTLFNRVSALQTGLASNTTGEADRLEFSRMIENFNSIDKGFEYAMSLTTAILVSHMAAIRNELKALVK